MKKDPSDGLYKVHWMNSPEKECCIYRYSESAIPNNLLGQEKVCAVEIMRNETETGSVF